ncbi:hypothetical protein K2X40_02100 [Candidatus Babeliales bacterium]|nr:hypothetical protein [Candidatus Babeliales bacterium]
MKRILVARLALYVGILGLGLFLASCTKEEKTLAGVAIGAGSGALIGGAAGGGTGAAIGAVSGGLLGGVIGNAQGDDKPKADRK